MNPKELVEIYGVEPKKSLGQNFLHDPNALDKIVATAGITPEDAVLEVGPGTGALTTRLAQVAKRLVTVEVDDRLAPILESQLAPYPHIEIIWQDILQVDVAALFASGPYVVVANLPYYITSAILRHLLESRHRPRRLVLMVQTEVAERIVAKPDEMSILAVSVQYYGKPRIATRLKPAAFWPRPDVDSAVLTIDTYAQPSVNVADERLFFQVVRAGFGQKRKQLKNALGSNLHLDSEQTASIFDLAGLDGRRRAETLTLAEWATLTTACSQLNLPSQPG
ncbi:MAG: 16S rRNA (adenine(1518)-N(6)/adenine(1519)-N(6))-dimethyltransferase RsmA [Anaerolineae bacterium]|nr:16S rRNA (adenine(1518)-N(6)/adenine(1519)-N(6))-dimethyltransferase RsmA [Anaerolineae bacterium]